MFMEPNPGMAAALHPTALTERRIFCSLNGCPKRNGCTLTVTGESMATLKSVKRVLKVNQLRFQFCVQFVLFFLPQHLLFLTLFFLSLVYQFAIYAQHTLRDECEWLCNVGAAIVPPANALVTPIISTSPTAEIAPSERAGQSTTTSPPSLLPYAHQCLAFGAIVVHHRKMIGFPFSGSFIN
jgi:hypothetical protein